MATIVGSIQIAIKTLAAWITQAPTLKEGQPVAVTDSGKTLMKVGDGSTAFSSLPFVTVKDTDVVAEGAANK